MKVTPKALRNDSERMYMMPAAASGTRAYNPFPSFFCCDPEETAVFAIVGTLTVESVIIAVVGAVGEL